MTTVTVSAKYADILAPLGDVQQAVDEAIRRYAVEKIGERMVGLRREIRRFEEQYGCTYEVFYAHITADEDFVAALRQAHPTWERDFHTWEFYVEELHEWLSRLEQLSTP